MFAESARKRWRISSPRSKGRVKCGVIFFFWVNSLDRRFDNAKFNPVFFHVFGKSTAPRAIKISLTMEKLRDCTSFLAQNSRPWIIPFTWKIALSRLTCRAICIFATHPSDFDSLSSALKKPTWVEFCECIHPGESSILSLFASARHNSRIISKVEKFLRITGGLKFFACEVGRNVD